MATTKINPVKQTLIKSIRYILNPEKTENGNLTAAFNCSQDPLACYRTMTNTKTQLNKTDKVQGHMIYFNFKPNETTPDQAFKIVKEFAKRYLSERFEVVLGIHTDKGHIHGHILFNSVSFEDSKKYHSNIGTYYNEIRTLADDLCRENGLSVIEIPAQKGVHYIEWKMEQQGFKTWKELARSDIDMAINLAPSFSRFLIQLENMGYTVINDPSHKHITIQPHGMKDCIRLSSRLGENYSEEAIRNRIANRLNSYQSIKTKPQRHRKKRFPFPYSKRNPHRKITRFQALYLRYKYQLGAIAKNKRVKKKHYPIRQDLKNHKRHLQAYHFIQTNKIQSLQDVHTLQDFYYSELSKAKQQAENIKEYEKPYHYDFRLLAEYERLKVAFFLSDDSKAFPVEKAEFLNVSAKLEKRGYKNDEQIKALSEKKAEIYEAKEQIKEHQRQVRSVLSDCKNALLSFAQIQTVTKAIKEYEENQKAKDKAIGKNREKQER